jgi:hypothetical protein
MLQIRIDYDPYNNPLNTTEWAFPLCEVIHIVGFAMAIGTIAMVDLRLMGLSMRQNTAAQLVKDTGPWTLGGLIMVLISGPLIFSSDPNLYLNNPSFRYKITTLLIAILFNYTIHRKVAMANAGGLWGGLVGLVSLAMWASLVAAGIFIAFVA